MTYLATIINCCTRDFSFLSSALSQAKLFSHQIIVPMADHFFDGSKEDVKLIQSAAHNFSYAQFLLYPMTDKVKHSSYFKRVGEANFWHNMSRYLGFCHLDERVDWVLFLDVDEIVDGKRFARWFSTIENRNCDLCKLANYWYFRDVETQAEEWEDSAVLIRRNKLFKNLFFHKEERNVFYDFPKTERKQRFVCDENTLPMIHHYSWVRSKETMLQKVRSWGHRDDRDWESLVEKEFKKNFSGSDFIHGYRYHQVKPFITPSLILKKKNLKDVQNLQFLSEECVTKLFIDTSFWLSLKEKLAIFSSKR